MPFLVTPTRTPCAGHASKYIFQLINPDQAQAQPLQPSDFKAAKCSFHDAAQKFDVGGDYQTISFE
jgi:hypothetical protein